MRNKKKVNIGWIISGVFFLVLLISASFAYFGMFTVNLENKVAVNIHASTIGNTSFIATSANLNVIVPTSGMFKGNTGLAAENTATLTVNLTGAQDVITTCTYDVVYEYDLSSEIYGSTVAVTSGATKEITMQVDSPSGTNAFPYEFNFEYNDPWTAKTSTVGAKRILVKGATIRSVGTSTLQKITVTGKYYNLNVDQSQLADKNFTGKIYVENNICSAIDVPEKASELILALNGGKEGIEAKGESTYVYSAVTNEGMYAIEDDLGTSYYFRGAVDNNWLKFGEVDGKSIYWRIIRINGDGSIRLLYTGTTAPTESQKVVMTGAGTQIGESIYNDNSGKAEYNGYKYEIGKQHGLANDSTIKLALENWYKTTLYTDERVSKLIVDTPFCYDRSASTSSAGTYGEISNWVSTGTDYYYHGNEIIYGDKTKVRLKCSNELDKYSVANGTLSYPIGLITIDEIVLAGGRNYGNSFYYLRTGQTYWGGSPYYYVNGNPTISIVQPSGYLNHSFIDSPNGIRPVINLSSEAKLSGDGTWNNPYVVES